MAWERLDISVLVVDDDDTSLTIVANILSSWEYKVLTANSARNALETLREFEGFFNLVISELHISGMNGYEFQRRVKDEFQLPVIMMSSDNRKSVMSKSLENGASLYVMKPVCADDFKDIWQYATAASKGKLVIENELRSGEGEPPDHEKMILQEAANSSASSSSVTSEPKRKMKCKRKSSPMNKEDQSEGTSRAQKRPKIVWTTYLHNLFLLAIKHIGLDKAVPKKILEIMNVPNLTRENVASHLQKYRIFLRKVAEKGIIEGISDRALRSRFASELPVSVIKDIQTRAEKLSLPVQQYLKGFTPQSGQGVPTIQGLLGQQASSSAYVTTQLGIFPNPLQIWQVLQNQQAFNGYNNALNQVRLGQSSFGSRMIGTNINNDIQQNMLGSYGNTIYDQGNSSSYNAGPVIPAYGMGHHGLMTTSNALIGGLKYGDTMCQNYGSLGTSSFNYGLGNGKMASLSSSYNLPLSSAGYPSSSVSSGIQLNDGSQMAETGVQGGFNNVGITAAITNNNTNSFSLMSGTPNANMNATPLGDGNSGLVQGCYASPADDVYASELSAGLVTNATPEENTSGIQQLPQQLDGPGNAAGHEHQCNASTISEGQAIQLDDDLSKLFLMLDDVQLLNETGEDQVANEFLNSDFSSSSQLVQSPNQPQIAGDVIVPSTENINMPNGSTTTSTDKCPIQLQGNDGFLDWYPFDRLFGDNDSTASSSIIEQDWDMDLIEAMFGTKVN